MNEKQILFEIRQIASKAASFSDAIEEIGRLIERGIGGNVLLVRVPEKDTRDGYSIARHAESFFDETEGLPHRSLYSVSFRAHRRELGKLVAFFASGCSHQGVAERLAGFCAEQLGILLEKKLDIPNLVSVGESQRREMAEPIAVAP